MAGDWLPIRLDLWDDPRIVRINRILACGRAAAVGACVRLWAAVERYGMSGAERVFLYRTAIESGLRAGELRSLTRRSLVLDATRPYIVAAAGSTKNRRRAQQYIRADLGASVRRHVARKTPTAPMFDLPAKWRVADMLRENLAAARRAWIDEADRDPEELARREQSDFLAEKNHAGQVLDFHARRHTCGAWLVLAGVSLNVVRKVMRHSTITLTIDTYGHEVPGAEADAVDGLAGFFLLGKRGPSPCCERARMTRPSTKAQYMRSTKGK